MWRDAALRITPSQERNDGVDTIFLNGMIFYAYHGVFPEENKIGQRFLVSLELDCDLRAAAVRDDLALSVDYGEVYNMTRDIVQGKVKKLVESVAEDLANAILARFPTVNAVRVKVEKPEAPIPGIFAAIGVMVKRERIQEN